MENVKVALVHDWLTGQRGGEKVLEALAEIYPDAPIYTLFHFPGSQAAAIEKRVIRTSFLQNLPFMRKRYRWYLPLFPLAAEMFNLQDFDLIISSSHCVAKGIIPPPDALHISYIHSPVRYAWNQYDAYFAPRKLSVFSKLLIPPQIHMLRIWDVTSAARVDHFVANSRGVARRIEKYYRRPAEVIHPPVDTDFYRPPDGDLKRSYDLVVTALVPYKMIELAVDAYNRLGWPLKVVGDGPDEKKLRRLAGPNVQFLGPLASGDLRGLYQAARALVMPGEEDFGIAAVEAQACGTPVVAYGRGGALETVLDGKTGVLFGELTSRSLLAALDKLRTVEFNKSVIRAHALGFSRNIFKNKMTAAVREKWRAFRDAS